MTIKLYWHRGEGKRDPKKQNFGDFLSPIIVEAVSGKSVAYAPPEKADLFAIGSVLKREKKAKFFGMKRTLHIWGAGAASEAETYGAHHYYHAVRGPLTLDKVLGNKEGVVFGDPGLLAENIVPAAKKRYQIGVVPHLLDKGASQFQYLLSCLDNPFVIDVFDPPRDVLRQISQCHALVSSSLHGLIVADAYGVPCLHSPFSKGMVSEFKFHDYFLSTGREYVFLNPQSVSSQSQLLEEIHQAYVRPDLQGMQGDLVAAFPDL